MSDDVKTMKMVFPTGDYAHALSCYFEAQEWVQFSGLLGYEGYDGYLHSPAHPQMEKGSRYIPEELVDADGWSVTVDYRYTDDAFLMHLQSIPMPEGVVLVLGEENKS